MGFSRPSQACSPKQLIPNFSSQASYRLALSTRCAPSSIRIVLPPAMLHATTDATLSVFYLYIWLPKFAYSMCKYMLMPTLYEVQFQFEITIALQGITLKRNPQI